VFRIRRTHWFRIRIQHFRPNTDPDQGFWWPIIGKNLQLEKNLILFWSKITIHFLLGIHKGRQCYRRSLQLSKENIQNFKTWNFLTFFYFFSQFCPPGSGSGSTDLIDSGSNPDPDRKHRIRRQNFYSNHIVTLVEGEDDPGRIQNPQCRGFIQEGISAAL
jgi:hypothetical protein